MKLLDLNVLLYAVNCDTPHHAAARKTLETMLNGNESVGLAWVVLLGFIRISTNPRIFPSPLDPENALELVDQWLELPMTELVAPGPSHWSILKGFLQATGSAGNLTTDAHLATFAVENNATLVSFDTDFQRFPQLKLLTLPLRR